MLRTLAALAAAFAVVGGGMASGAHIDRQTTLVSHPSSAADTDDSAFVGASADGSRIFFRTRLRLTTDDNDAGREDVYERSGGTTTLVSQPTAVPDPDSADVLFAGASADGSRVFLRTTQKLTAEDNDGGRFDVYERAAGTTTLVSQTSGVPDAAPLFDVEFAGASADGSRVFFRTAQKLTADDDDSFLVDVYERAGGTTTLISQPTGVTDTDSDDVGFTGASVDGSRVFFSTTQRMTGDDNDTAFSDIYERAGGTTTLLSGPAGVPDANSGDVLFTGASADGGRVFFNTSQKLTADDNDTSRNDVYERTAGATTLITQPTGVPDPDSGPVFPVRVTVDGGRVFFQTPQRLTAEDNDTNRLDIYERSGGTTTLISQPTGVEAPDVSTLIAFVGASADGSRVYFDTTVRMTADDNDSGGGDIFERAGGTTTLVSQPTGVPDPSLGSTSFAGASADGSRVFFQTANKLTADDNDSGVWHDVYERSGGTTTLLSRPTGVADPGNENVGAVRVSADGQRIVMQTDGRLTADDLDANRTDVYVSADTAAPETTITDGPSGDTGDETPSFSFSSSEAESTFECRLDGGVFVPCTPPLTLGPLATGPHSFEVRARDNVGNVDATPATSAFTVVDATPAAFSNYRLSPSVFRAAPRGPAIAARRPIGTRVSYVLSEPATVTFRVERAAKGRRVRGKCRRPTPRNRGHRPCRRYVTLAGSFKHRGATGANRFRFLGRLRGRKLPAGSYRLRARPVDLAGNASPVARRPFRIVRR